MGVLGQTRKSLNINPQNYGWENDYATQIQKHVKGFLTRKKFNSDIQMIKKVSKKQFKQMQSRKEVDL